MNTKELHAVINTLIKARDNDGADVQSVIDSLVDLAEEMSLRATKNDSLHDHDGSVARLMASLG